MGGPLGGQDDDHACRAAPGYQVPGEGGELFPLGFGADGGGEVGVLPAVVVLGIIGTGLSYVLNYQIIASEGATVASTVTYLLPVVAIILGVLVLGEAITALMLAGIALILAGVALTRQRTQQ